MSKQIIYKSGDSTIVESVMSSHSNNAGVTFSYSPIKAVEEVQSLYPVEGQKSVRFEQLVETRYPRNSGIDKIDFFANEESDPRRLITRRRSIIRPVPVSKSLDDLTAMVAGKFIARQLSNEVIIDSKQAYRIAQGQLDIDTLAETQIVPMMSEPDANGKTSVLVDDNGKKVPLVLNGRHMYRVLFINNTHEDIDTRELGAEQEEINDDTYTGAVATS